MLNHEMTREEKISFLLLSGWTLHEWQSKHDAEEFVTIERRCKDFCNIDLDDLGIEYLIFAEPDFPVPKFQHFFTLNNTVKYMENKVGRPSDE